MATTWHAEGPPPVKTVPAVNMDRYVGEWFEIARFPARSWKRCAGASRITFTRSPGGAIAVTFSCRANDGAVVDSRGVARVADARTSAKLQIRFAPAALSWLPFVWSDYWIAGLADDYSWAVMCSPDRRGLWILSRTPQLDEERYARAVAAARANAFDVGRLVTFVP